MQIVVFGSTGKTGRQVVMQALAQGHRVVAAARTPEKLAIEHDRLSVVACDVLQPDTLSVAVQGCDAVVVAIGGAGLGDDRTRTEGTRSILAAMALQGVSRILVVSTVGVGDSIGQLGLVGRMFVWTVIRKAVADHAGQEALVRDSGTRWTIARPGGLTDGPATDGGYRADPDGTITVSQIARADVAHFLLSMLANPESEGKIYALSR